MKISFFFLILHLLIIFTITQVESSQEGFIQVEIYNKGIDYAKDVLLSSVIDKLLPLEVAPIENPVKIALIGTVHITLSNIVLSTIELDSSTIEAGDTGVTLVASGAKAYMTMDWSYTYGSWIKISAEGTAEVEVQGMEIGMTVDVKNQKGTIKLSLLDCGCYVSDISITIHGGASWLYNGLVRAFKGKIRTQVEDTITQKVEDEITDFKSSLESIPKQIKVNEIVTLNVTIVNDLVLSSTSLGFEIDGLFTSTRSKVVSSDFNPQVSVSCEGPPKMLGISIHEEVFNSALLTYYSADLMHWIVDELPDRLLNTRKWKYVIPRLYKLYPDDDMNLNVSVTSPPNIKVARDSIDVTVHVDFTIEVLNDGEVTPVACITSVVSLSAHPEMSRNSLSGSVNLNKFSMSLEWSKIGPFHMTLLKNFVETVLRTIVTPYVDLILYKGIPLPDFKGYILQYTQFNFIGPRIIICSDVASLEHGGLFPHMVSDLSYLSES